jgi:uncharacterized iron-regulated membrane protein
MRTLHRLLAIIALGVLLWIGCSGSLIQSLDLYALLRHAPETDPTIMSMNEGRYGPRDFEVLSKGDFTAAPLPQDLDYGQSLTTVLQAFHQHSPEAAPRFVELRMVNGEPVGQVRAGKDVQAFDAKSGAAVAGVDSTYALIPPSLRQTLKTLHRFWIHQDLPGVWVELIMGLVLWVLLISGLTLYFKLVSARARLKRRNPYWFAGGWWRSMHRIISVTAAVFLILVAFSGTWLGFESVAATFNRPPGPRRVDASSPLSDGDVQQMASATLAAMRSDEPKTPIRVIRLRAYGTMKQGVIITGDAVTRQLVFDTKNGQTASLNEPGYPSNAFPFGTQVHENIKHFHAAMPFGLIGRFLDLFAGLSLVFLCISGLTMYLDLWHRRRKSGRAAFFWA